MVCLVPLEERHLPRTFGWLSDPFVAENLGLRKKPSWEYTLHWQENAVPANGIWAFAIQADSRHVGNLILDQMDENLRSIRLFLFIGEPDCRGKGIAADAIQLALEFSFSKLKLNKVWLHVHEQNLSAIRLYQKSGFSHEGILKEEFHYRGSLIQMHHMAILQKDFQTLRAG